MINPMFSVASFVTLFIRAHACTSCEMSTKRNNGRPGLRWVDNTNEVVTSLGPTLTEQWTLTNDKRTVVVIYSYPLPPNGGRQEQMMMMMYTYMCHVMLSCMHKNTDVFMYVCIYGGLQVRIPLQPPCRDLGQVLHSQLPVALRRVNSDTVSML